MARINELIRKSIVFLGILDETGAFAPYGTGFLVGWPADFDPEKHFQYLVTAKHVVDDMAASGRPMVCRVDANDGTAKVGRAGEEWEMHPTDSKCDVAVTGFACSRDTFDFRVIGLDDQVLTSGYIEQNDIGCGDEVFTAGLLVSHFGRNKNVPVIRIGAIAAMPEEHVDLGDKLGQQEVYLIESRSIGGLSGSPVFLNTPPARIVDRSVVTTHGHQREYLMGVNIGLFETSAHGDKLRNDTVSRREHFLEAMSVPIERVLEIIEHGPKLKRAREVRKQKELAGGGFVPTSSRPATANGDAADLAPLANAENRTRREDFTHLSGAAARKPAQED